MGTKGKVLWSGAKGTSRHGGGHSSLLLVHMGTKEAPAPAGRPQLRLTPRQDFPLATLSWEQIFPGQEFGRVGVELLSRVWPLHTAVVPAPSPRLRRYQNLVTGMALLAPIVKQRLKIPKYVYLCLGWPSTAVSLKAGPEDWCFGSRDRAAPSTRLFRRKVAGSPSCLSKTTSPKTCPRLAGTE